MKKKALPLVLSLLLCLGLTVQIAAAASSQPSASQVYSAMIALKDTYPEGMRWTNENGYNWNGGIYSGGYGCAAFAFILSDAAFGTLPARMLTTFSYSDVRVGDILRINGDTHSVIVLEVHSDHVVLAEGNYNSSIHWGRSLTKTEVMRADYLMTRYPEAVEDTPAVPDEPDNTPTVPDEPDNTPAVPDEPDNTPAVPDEPDNTPVVPDEPDNTPVVPDEPDNTPVVPDEPDNTPVAPDEPDNTPVVPDEPDNTPAPCFYTVTFKINSSSNSLTDPKPLQVLAGGKVTLPNDPVWEGRTFLGWYSGTVVGNELRNAVKWSNDDKVCKNVTLYALWGEDKTPAVPDNSTDSVDSSDSADTADAADTTAPADSTAPAAPSAPEPQPAVPAVTVEDIPASGTAVASIQTVLVDDKEVEFQMYALLDASGYGTNYIKLRDMAFILNGTQAQFSVGYDIDSRLISLATSEAYTVTNTEMSTPFSGDRPYTGGALTVKINGLDVDMTAITLLDDAGGGYNYFKLRDLGAALGFNVGYSLEQGVYIESNQPYAG